MLISLELVQTHTHEDHDFTYDVSQKKRPNDSTYYKWYNYTEVQ